MAMRHLSSWLLGLPLFSVSLLASNSGLPETQQTPSWRSDSQIHRAVLETLVDHHLVQSDRETTGSSENHLAPIQEALGLTPESQQEQGSLLQILTNHNQFLRRNVQAERLLRQEQANASASQRRNINTALSMLQTLSETILRSQATIQSHAQQIQHYFRPNGTETVDADLQAQLEIVANQVRSQAPQPASLPYAEEHLQTHPFTFYFTEGVDLEELFPPEPLEEWIEGGLHLEGVTTLVLDEPMEATVLQSRGSEIPVLDLNGQTLTLSGGEGGTFSGLLQDSGEGSLVLTENQQNLDTKEDSFVTSVSVKGGEMTLGSKQTGSLRLGSLTVETDGMFSLGTGNDTPQVQTFALRAFDTPTEITPPVSGNLSVRALTVDGTFLVNKTDAFTVGSLAGTGSLNLTEGNLMTLNLQENGEFEGSLEGTGTVALTADHPVTFLWPQRSLFEGTVSVDDNVTISEGDPDSTGCKNCQEALHSAGSWACWDSVPKICESYLDVHGFPSRAYDFEMEITDYLPYPCTCGKEHYSSYNCVKKLPLLFHTEWKWGGAYESGYVCPSGFWHSRNVYCRHNKGTPYYCDSCHSYHKTTLECEHKSPVAWFFQIKSGTSESSGKAGYVNANGDWLALNTRLVGSTEGYLCQCGQWHTDQSQCGEGRTVTDLTQEEIEGDPDSTSCKYCQEAIHSDGTRPEICFDYQESHGFPYRAYDFEKEITDYLPYPCPCGKEHSISYHCSLKLPLMYRIDWPYGGERESGYVCPSGFWHARNVYCRHNKGTPYFCDSCDCYHKTTLECAHKRPVTWFIQIQKGYASSGKAGYVNANGDWLALNTRLAGTEGYLCQCGQWHTDQSQCGEGREVTDLPQEAIDEDPFAIVLKGSETYTLTEDKTITFIKSQPDSGAAINLQNHTLTLVGGDNPTFYGAFPESSWGYSGTLVLTGNRQNLDTTEGSKPFTLQVSRGTLTLGANQNGVLSVYQLNVGPEGTLVLGTEGGAEGHLEVTSYVDLNGQVKLLNGTLMCTGGGDADSHITFTGRIFVGEHATFILNLGYCNNAFNGRVTGPGTVSLTSEWPGTFNWPQRSLFEGTVNVGENVTITEEEPDSTGCKYCSEAVHLDGSDPAICFSYQESRGFPSRAYDFEMDIDDYLPYPCTCGKAHYISDHCSQKLPLRYQIEWQGGETEAGYVCPSGFWHSQNVYCRHDKGTPYYCGYCQSYHKTTVECEHKRPVAWFLGIRPGTCFMGKAGYVNANGDWLALNTRLADTEGYLCQCGQWHTNPSQCGEGHAVQDLSQDEVNAAMA